MFDGQSSLADAIALRLKGAGIDTIFGIPGTHVIELYRGFDHHGIRPVTPRHEQAVGFAATAWGQLKGVPGVAVTTSGPGLLNVLAAAATAYCESRGLIVLSPGVPTGTPEGRIGILHETKDSIGAADSVMAWSRRAQSAEHAMELLEEAFLTQTKRSLPVHIEIPIDLFTEAVSPISSAGAGQAESNSVSANVQEEELRAAAALLKEARTPRILAGGGATLAATELRTIAESLGAPVATTINGKGVLDEQHPLALGAELRLAALHQDFEKADVLLVVGSKLAEAEFWSGPFKPTGKVIRIDKDPVQIRTGINPELAIVGDARELLHELMTVLGQTENAEPASIDDLQNKMASEAAGLGGATLELANRLAEWIPENAVISMDSSQICYLGMNTAVKSRLPGRLLQAAAYSPLGMGLPGAIGAALAHPEQKAWCVTGDGALMFSVQELITASEEELDLTLVVVENGGYREIAENMQDANIRPQGVELRQPDWPALGEAFGAASIMVDSDASDEEFARAGAFANEPGLKLIHVRQR